MVREEPLAVLVVDDSEFFAGFLADRLESEHGIRTTATTDAAGVPELVDGMRVDCIVSDYEMPERSGLELYRAIDGSYDLPFILLTGEGDEEVASRAIGMGVDEYLLKRSIGENSSLDLLVNRIRNVVEQRRTRQRYEQLVDASPDEISQLRPDGEIITANGAMATAFGTTPAELAGSQLSTFLPEAVATGRLEEVRRALAVGGAVTFQDSIGMRHFHNIAVPMAAAGGGESVQLVTREMTLQKRSERKLERKSEELMLINRLVRHDINNDVQLLVGWADLLGEHVDGEGAELVDRIERRSGHIAELTAIARDFVDSLEGDREVPLEPVRLDRVLEAEVEKRRSDAPDATFRVRGETEAVVRANELLSSVIGNLLSNAVRHNDTERPTVEVSVHTEGTEVVLRVADDGPGVPDDRKEGIFGKGTMDSDSPGTGVGLYLVRRLVEQYDGAIGVEDNEPRGAAFVVELQRHGDATAGVEAARSARGGNAPRG